MDPKCLPVEKTIKVFGLTIKSSAVVTKIFASALVVICCPDVLDLTRLNVKINVKLITPI